MTGALASDSAVLPGLGRIYFDARSRDEVEFLHREIFIDQEYLRHGISIRPGAMIVDAGANIGLFSIWAERVAGGQCSILALEPVPETFARLRLNWEEHGLWQRPGMSALPLGLGRIGGPTALPITVYPGLPGSSTVDPASKVVEHERLRELRLAQVRGNKFLERTVRRELDDGLTPHVVDCAFAPLSEVLRTHAIGRIDLLKVDVEGAELDVLLGLDEETWPQVQQVVLETTGSERAASLEALLRSVGLGRVHVERPRWAEYLGLDNLNLYATR